MTAYTSRANLFGTIIWTQPLASATIADRTAALIEAVSIDNECASFRDLARALDVHGVSLVLKVDHHGERDNWIAQPRKDGWFAQQLEAA